MAGGRERRSNVGSAALQEATLQYDACVRSFQRGLRITALAAVPAAILIAAVLGTFTSRELLYTIIVIAIFALIVLPVAHAVDRKYMNYVRDRLGSEAELPFDAAISHLKWFRIQVVLNFIVAYVVGSGLAITIANHFAGLPIWTNLLPVTVAGLVGGALVDGALNYFNAEALIAELVAILSSVRERFAPISDAAKGGIARRVLVVLAIVIAVTVIAMGGGALHLLLELEAGRVKGDDVLRIGGIYAAASLAVAILIALLASRILSRSIQNPILHTVELMDRLRQGDVLQPHELYGQPRFSHEAGLLVAAFADANIGLARLATSGERLASGDLAVKIEPSSDRDVVAIAFRRVVEAIRTVVGNVRETAALLETSAHALTLRTDEFVDDSRANSKDLSQAVLTMSTLDRAVEHVAEGSRELSSMAATARQTADRLGAAAQSNAAGLDELAQTAKATIDAANDVLEISSETGRNADAASAAILQADRTAEEAANVMSELVKTIESLRENSLQIGSITEKIDEISDQTNLLALNAAIEAARAGEHGRGFAVVADEIRKLADSSATSTKEIAALIHSVQRETDTAVAVTRRGSSAVQQGRAKTSQVADALSLIVDSVSLVRARIEGVVIAQREQKQATDALVESTLMVERLTGDNAHLANTLSDLAEALQSSSASGAEAVRSTTGGVHAVAKRGERIAEASDELQELTASLRAEAERIRSAIAGLSYSDGAESLPRGTGGTALPR